APGTVTTIARSTRVPQFLNTPLGSIVMALGQALDEPLNFTATSPPVFHRIGPHTAVVLKDGFRLNPEFAEKILLAGEIEVLSDDVLSRVFQAVAAPPDRVAFKYAIFDEGSGREFQSEPILNIAGLGSADGKRPFRYFARPIEFAPRSTIRLEITEVSAFEGELHVSLQGYKTLGTVGTPTAARPMRGRGNRGTAASSSVCRSSTRRVHRTSVRIAACRATTNILMNQASPTRRGPAVRWFWRTSNCSRNTAGY